MYGIFYIINVRHSRYSSLLQFISKDFAGPSCLKAPTQWGALKIQFPKKIIFFKPGIVYDL